MVNHSDDNNGTIRSWLKTIAYKQMLKGLRKCYIVSTTCVVLCVVIRDCRYEANQNVKCRQYLCDLFLFWHKANVVIYSHLKIINNECLYLHSANKIKHYSLY